MKSGSVELVIAELVIAPDGTARCLYSDDLDLAGLGEVRVSRASHCEPGEHGQWWADLAPVGGPKIGPFPKRAHALEEEVAWLRRNWLCGRGVVDLK